MTRSFLISTAIIITVSMVLAFGYAMNVELPNVNQAMDLHASIIAGDAPAPYRQRVLVPWLVESVLIGAQSRLAFIRVYVMYDMLAIMITLISMYVLLGEWFTSERALLGVLFMAATIPIAFRDYYFQPWSLIEPGLFAMALLAINRRRYAALAAITIVASLNRETGVFIPLMFLAATAGSFKAHIWYVGLFSLWVAVFVGLRVALHGDVAASVQDIFSINANLASIVYAAVVGMMMLGCLAAFATLGFTRAPRIIQRVALVIPLYLAIVAVFGVWYEVRLLMPLYPIITPMALAFMEEPCTSLKRC